MQVIIKSLTVPARAKVDFLKFIESIQRLGCTSGEKFVVVKSSEIVLNFKLTWLDRLRFPNACEWIEGV